MKNRFLGSFLPLTRAWMLGIIRDRSTVFWMFAFPILFVVLFGLAFGQENVGGFKVGVVVDRSTETGQALVQAFESVPALEVSTDDQESELEALRDGDRYAVVVTQSGESVGGAGPETVVVYYDPSRGTAAQVVLPIVQQVVGGVNQQLSGQPPTLTVQTESVRSNDLRFIDFFLPGVIGFSIMQAGMFAAIPFVQLRVTKVLKRFSATPVSRWSILGSQGVTRLILAVVQTIVLLVVGRLLFDVHTGNNVLGTAAFVLLGGMTFLCMGLAVSGLAKTEESVPALVQAVSFPMMFLAGVFWPIEAFPDVVQVIARVLPLTFLGDGLRQVMVGGAALYPLWVDFLALLAWTAVSAVLAVRFFRWE
jgi:ABC-2 type transport system permease protein